MDLLEPSNIWRAIERTQPSEVYNLAAQSFVALSFEQPLYTTDADAMGPLRLLEAIRDVDPQIRFYQASTSEMFGKVRETPQTEATPFHPRSPYGVAKLFAHWIAINYRESYGMHTCSGILFNHESPLRGTEFVTRKITANLAAIKHGRTAPLELGNMDAKRDWGFAGDYVDGMVRMLQADKPDDYVLATGETHTVREFVEHAANVAGIPLNWQGEGASEQARSADGQLVVQIRSEFYRPAEVDLLLGDATKARTELGWSPSTSFESLVQMMMRADLDRAAEGRLRI
jgi:GDPmannose 4,6-dehydratase